MDCQEFNVSFNVSTRCQRGSLTQVKAQVLCNKYMLHTREDAIPAQTRCSFVLILAVLSANKILKVETSDEKECLKLSDPLALLEAAMGHRQAWGS